jgi:hypothetical protein
MLYEDHASKLNLLPARQPQKLFGALAFKLKLRLIKLIRMKYYVGLENKLKLLRKQQRSEDHGSKKKFKTKLQHVKRPKGE